jgi:hypothetical protein
MLAGGRAASASVHERRSWPVLAPRRLKRRYSDRATARIHVSATRCVNQPSKPVVHRNPMRRFAHARSREGLCLRFVGASAGVVRELVAQ